MSQANSHPKLIPSSHRVTDLSPTEVEVSCFVDGCAYYTVARNISAAVQAARLHFAAFGHVPILAWRDCPLSADVVARFVELEIKDPIFDEGPLRREPAGDRAVRRS
jgi:hypothetical protein